MKKDIFNWIILGIVTFVLIGLEFYSIKIDSRYKWDAIFLFGLLLVVFFLRKKLNINPVHFLFLGLFLIIHNLGVFGLYRNFYFGIEYDIYVHAFFGLISSLILFRAFGIKKNKSFVLMLMVVGLVIGMATFHELFEATGALVLGEGEGVLFMGAGDIDEWDIQKDILMNLIGGIFGVAGYFIFAWIGRLRRKKKSSGDDDESVEKDDNDE